MEHKGTKTIETKRLILRKFSLDDVDSSYNNWTSDNQVTKYLTWPTHASKDVTRNVIKEWIDNYQNDNFYQWAIVLKDNHEVIGTISVVDINEKIDCVCIGYCIGSQYWRNGYTSEAFDKVIQFLFEDVKVNRIESHHDVNNPNSGRVMKKCGMTYEGTMKQADFNNQGIVDLVVYGYIAEDYFQKTKSMHDLE